MFKTLKRNFFPFIIALSALSVSASAAFYSVSGLSKLFAGASFEVIIMAGSLEVAKLVIASLLYQYWDSINKGLRAYLSMATVILVLITSMGIYGFLSAAYQETYAKLLVQDNEIEYIENKAQFYEDDLARYDIELARISENINILSNAKASGIQVRDTTSSTGFRQTISTTELRLAQKRIETEEVNRKSVQAKRQVAADSLQTFRLQILDLQNTSETAGELGPLQYLSGLTGTPMDKIINWLLLVIIFVFDPLAISLVVAANFAFDQARREDEDDTEYTPRDSAFLDIDKDDDLPPNDDLKRAAQDYVEDILDEGTLRPENPNANAMDVSMDKENADAWGQLADELARHTVESEEEENAWLDDPDVQAFLKNEDRPGPWSEEDDKVHTVGGLTNDKEGSFMKFQKKQDSIGIQDPYDAAVDRHAPEDTEESHSDHLYEEPNLSRIKESAEEWDEDHALDQVLNDMVEDLEEDTLMAETEADLGLAEAELEELERETEVIDPDGVSYKWEVEDTQGNVNVYEDGDEFPNENNPTSVAATVVKDLPNDFGTYPPTVQKIETPHLPKDESKVIQRSITEDPVLPEESTELPEYDEDTLFDQAMREQARKDMKDFLKDNENDNK